MLKATTEQERRDIEKTAETLSAETQVLPEEQKAYICGLLQGILQGLTLAGNKPIASK
mgnify:FL=1